MTDEEINIAISLQQGWRDIIIYDKEDSKDPFCRALYGTVDGVDPETGARWPLNDYAGSHLGHDKLLHYLEYKYTGTFYGPESWLTNPPAAYLGNLQQILKCDDDEIWLFVTASPRQKSEAFLRTVGLWKGQILSDD